MAEINTEGLAETLRDRMSAEVRIEGDKIIAVGVFRGLGEYVLSSKHCGRRVNPEDYGYRIFPTLKLAEVHFVPIRAS